MEVPKDSYASSAFVKNYEYPLAISLTEQLSPQSVFYDVGAHYGYFTELAKQDGVPAKNIHCFEMHDFTHYILSKNQQQSQVNINNVRVSSESGPETISMDNYARTNPDADVIKIDVEGAEYDVLQGMNRTLEVVQPVLFIEMHPHLIGGFDASIMEVFDTLTTHSYQTEWLNHSTDEMSWSGNLEACPTDETFLIRSIPN